MPDQVKQIIEGKTKPVCVVKEDPVSKALSLMIEHDFSQLPVIRFDGGFDIPDGIITYEGILRGVRNFNAKLEDLKVRDVMVLASTYNVENDLFDILDGLKDTNCVLVLDSHFPDLVGIVTSYDVAEYFRDRTEDMMRVEDIELIIKEFAKAAYTKEDDEIDEIKLGETISKVMTYANKDNNFSGKSKGFSDLTLTEYISILLMKETWPFFASIFNVPRDFIKELLYGVRDIRNALAHFRGDISAEQRDKLRFASEWLTRCQDEYHERKENEKNQRLMEKIKKGEITLVPIEYQESDKQQSPNVLADTASTDFSVTESATSGGRYAALADWLQSQPGRIDEVSLPLNQIEEIIGGNLPASARSHRVWWANDSQGHPHSDLWLEAGWRTTYVNLGVGKITFSRIREREKAYITFFSKLLVEFRKKADFSIRDASPDGTSWIVIQTIPRSGGSVGQFTFSFTREKQLRVELYLDLGDQAKTKLVFDKLFNQREEFHSQLGEIKWERLDNRRASRLALYHEGYIVDEQGHVELRKWAAETMVKFYNTLAQPAEKAILEVRNG